MLPVERLAKLIPMLSSDKQGEVLATVAAIGRTLQNAGCDWHDLAKNIGIPAAQPQPRYTNAPYKQHKPKPTKLEPWHVIAASCIELGEKFGLTHKEYGFLMGIIDSVYCPSQKQMKWLYGIEAKLIRKKQASP